MHEAQARQALTHYALPAYSLTFLAQTHNVVYRVQSPDLNAILRLSDAKHANLEHIASEMALLNGLAEANFPYRLPTPIADKQGAWVVSTDDAHAVLTHYLEGDLRTPDTLTEDEAEALGRAIAHLHAWDYDIPTDFTRPKLDMAGMFGQGGLYALGEAHPLITPQQAATMQAALGRVNFAFKVLGVNDYQFGLIHGDLLLPNVLFGDTLGLLDFEYCGWGYYLYDLTPLLWQLKPQANYAKLEARIWKGYTSVRPKLGYYKHMLETLIAARHVASMRWVALNADNPHIAPHAERILAQRTQELTGFLLTGRLKRKPFVP
jgi:Ser/Thr protein kinase RdoA (MazF antagonist)